MKQCDWLPNKMHPFLSHNLSCCYWLLCDSVNDARGTLHQPNRQGRSVTEAFAALWRSVQLPFARNGNKHQVLTTMDKLS